MLTRRDFVGSVAAGLMATSPAPARAGAAGDEPRKKLAVVTTLWNYRSHAWHMAERFLGGLPDRRGTGTGPPLEVVSAYVDQTPEGRPEPRAGRGVRLHDLSDHRRGPALRRRQAGRRCRAASSASTATIRSTRSARSSIRATSSSSRSSTSSAKDGRTTPVFNDKHLSWKWEWAKEMVETSRAMGFPFLAGSSLPVTWRMPAIDMPLRGRGRGGAVRRDRRRRHLRLPRPGDDPVHGRAAARAARRAWSRCRPCAATPVWKAHGGRLVDAGGWDPRLFEACLSPQPDARPAADVQPPLPDRRRRCASGSRSRSPTASSTPTA